MILDTIYNRDNVSSAKGQIARKAERLLQQYPGAAEVAVYRRGGGSAPVRPARNQIAYVAAKGGKWSRSAEQRIGVGVGPSLAELARQELGHWGSVAERAVALYSLRCLSRCLVDAAALGLLASRGLEIDLGALEVMGDVIESVGGDRRIAQAIIAYTTNQPWGWRPVLGYAVTAAEQYVPVAL